MPADPIAAILDLGLGDQLAEQTKDKTEEQKKKLLKPVVPDNAYGTNLMKNAVTDLLGTQ